MPSFTRQLQTIVTKNFYQNLKKHKIEHLRVGGVEDALMSKPLVSDALWELVEPLLPPEPPKPRGGRSRVGPAGANGYFVRTQNRHSAGGPAPGDGLRQRNDLLAPVAGLARSRSMGAPTPRCLERLQAANRLDWSRAVVDSASQTVHRHTCMRYLVTVGEGGLGGTSPGSIPRTGPRLAASTI